VHCGEPRFSDYDLKQISLGLMGCDVWQVPLIRDDGNKTIVALCEKCYVRDDLDLDLIRSNLYASEKDFAESKGDKSLIDHAEGFKDLKFVSREGK
jgi:hypothetical protein